MINVILDIWTMYIGKVSSGTTDSGTVGEWGNETMVTVGRFDTLALEQWDIRHARKTCQRAAGVPGKLCNIRIRCNLAG